MIRGRLKVTSSIINFKRFDLKCTRPLSALNIFEFREINETISATAEFQLRAYSVQRETGSRVSRGEALDKIGATVGLPSWSSIRCYVCLAMKYSRDV